MSIVNKKERHGEIIRTHCVPVRALGEENEHRKGADLKIYLLC